MLKYSKICYINKSESRYNMYRKRLKRTKEIEDVLKKLKERVGN